MARHLVLAGLVGALILGCVPAANADAWVRWKDQLTPQYMEVVEAQYDDPLQLERYVWQIGSDFFAPDLLEMDSGSDFHNCDWPEHWRVVGGGSGAWREGDPSIPIYVRLLTKFKNVGTEDWIDFHLRAISGCNVYGKYVTDYGLWTRYWDYTSDPVGWDYIMDPTYEPYWGPEYGPVYTNEYFVCETWIEVTSPTGDWEVELWPTADAVVPEPSALMALGVGFPGLAMSLLRRRRSR